SHYRPTSTPYASFFYFNDPTTTEIYTLSLHDALPISRSARKKAVDVETVLIEEFQVKIPAIGAALAKFFGVPYETFKPDRIKPIDRKSTRLNSSHVAISYAVFCLKKKKISLR